MSWSLTDLGTAGGGTAAISISGVNVPKNALIIAAIDDMVSAAGTFSDSAGNSYSKVASTTGNQAVFYTVAASALVGGTLTYTSSAGAKTISALFATGNVASVATVLDSAVTNSTGFTASGVGISSGVPTQAGDLIVGIVFQHNGGGVVTSGATVAAPFLTPPLQHVTGGSTSEIVIGGVTVNSKATAVTFSASWTNTVTGSIMTVGFLAQFPVVDIGTNAGAVGSNSAITGVTTPPGALIVVATEDHGGNGTVTDSAGNTYTRVALPSSSLFPNMFYSPNSLANSAGNITYHQAAGALNASVMSACYITNMEKTSPLDTVAQATAAISGSPSSVTITSNVPTEPRETFVGLAIGGIIGAHTITQSAGWWVPPDPIDNAGGAGQKAEILSGGTQYNNAVGTLTFNPSWTGGAVLTAGGYGVFGFRPNVVNDLGVAVTTTLGQTLNQTGMNVPAGATIIVCAVESNAFDGTVTDSAGNTYTRVHAAAGINLFYSINVAALSGGTIIYTPGGASRSVIASMYALDIVAFDPAVTKTQAYSGVTSLSMTSNVPQNSGELFIAFAAFQASGQPGTVAQSSGWLTPPDQVIGSFTGYGIALGADCINPGVSTVAWAPTFGGFGITGTALMVGFSFSSVTLPTVQIPFTQQQPIYYPDAPPFNQQVYMPRNLDPILMPGDLPPIANIGRTRVLQQEIASMWQPDPWQYAFAGGQQPFEPHRLNAGIPGFVAQNPNIVHPGRLPVMAEIADTWKPDPWTYSFMGGKQPFDARDLPAQLVAVAPPAVPPFTTGMPFVLQVEIVQGWQPPAWPYVFFDNMQPYQPGFAAVGSISTVPGTPPLVTNDFNTFIQQVVQAWQPPAWPFVWLVEDAQVGPYMTGPNTRFVTAIDLPPTIDAFYANLARILLSWQPEAWPYVFMGDDQPYSPTTASPKALDIGVPNPINPGRLGIVEQIVWRWQPEAWPYTFMGNLQPYMKGLLHVQNLERIAPLPLHPGRLPVMAEIAQTWQPDPFLYAPIGGWQPYMSNRLNPTVTATIAAPPNFSQRAGYVQQAIQAWWAPSDFPYGSFLTNYKLPKVRIGYTQVVVLG